MRISWQEPRFGDGRHRIVPIMRKELVRNIRDNRDIEFIFCDDAYKAPPFIFTSWLDKVVVKRYAYSWRWTRSLQRWAVWPIFVWRFRLLGINTSHLNWGTINRCRLGICRSLIRTRLPLGSRISHYWIKAIATPKTSECIPASFKQMNHAQWIQLFFFRQCVSNQRL